MGVQNESGFSRRESEITYSKWVFKMRGRPERFLMKESEITYSKWVFKMRADFQGGKVNHL